ncbi:hypothetical protein GF337_08610 [candidate division KSB1 bacterium]|nr:hypothetical protein [candidate division KSB1 bacterium]
MKRYITLLIIIGVIAPATLFSAITLQWESEPAEFVRSFQLSRIVQLDQTGDGIDEIIMLRENENGTTNELVIVDGTTKNIIGILVGLMDNYGTVNQNTFKGFFDCDGDGTREILIATGDDVYLIDPLTDTIEFQLQGKYRLLGTSGDGKTGPVDLYIGETEKNVIQVWGSDE